jgi:hypothetical protein
MMYNKQSCSPCPKTLKSIVKIQNWVLMWNVENWKFHVFTPFNMNFHLNSGPLNSRLCMCYFLSEIHISLYCNKAIWRCFCGATKSPTFFPNFPLSYPTVIILLCSVQNVRRLFSLQRRKSKETCKNKIWRIITKEDNPVFEFFPSHHSSLQRSTQQWLQNSLKSIQHFTRTLKWQFSAVVLLY